MPQNWNKYVGETIAGNYVVTGLLGEDGPAGVFGSDRPNAIIRIAPGETPDAERLASAWSLASTLDLPNVVRVFETGRTTLDDAPVVFAVSERPDDNVATALAMRPLAADEVRQILENVVPALESLHARGIAHGHIDPDSIVAIGDRIKLTSETVTKASSPAAFSSDIAELGKAVVEMLTRNRATDPEVIEQLPAPFAEIVRGTVNRLPGQQWSLADVQDALAGRPVRPRTVAPRMVPPAEPSQARSRSLLVPAVTAITVVALLIIGWLAFRKPSATEPAQVAQEQRVATLPPPNTAPQTPATRPSPVESTPERSRAGIRSGWAVVAAAYRDYDKAETRARSLRTKWSRTPVHVWPGRGEGKRYFVVLASGLTKDEAEQLRRRARSAGLPRDTYVTRITPKA